MGKQQNFEYIHGDLYGVAMEVLKKWVAQNRTRPMLCYAQHTEDGDIVATDSHRLIHIKGIHGFKEEYLVDPKNFTFAKGDFPNTKDLRNPGGYKESLVLSKEHIQLWLQLFKSLNQTLRIMKDRLGTATIHFKEEHIEVELNRYKIFVQLPYEVYQKPDMKALTLNVQYMRDALEAHLKMESEQIRIHLIGPMKPMILDDDKAVRTLILPVRTVEGSDNT
jgi:hypothetical protein